MTAIQFKNKWGRLFCVLPFFILDGKEKLKEKQATLKLLKSITTNEYDLGSDIFARFDIFCQKILKGVTMFDIIKKLVDHDRRSDSFQMAFSSDYEDRIEHVTYVVRSYSNKKDYDTYMCFDLKELEQLDFPSQDEKQNFLIQLINVYIEYGYLRNAVAIKEYFLRGSFTEDELKEFRSRCYLGVLYSDAYRFAGMLILEIWFGKNLRKNRNQLQMRA